MRRLLLGALVMLGACSRQESVPATTVTAPQTMRVAAGDAGAVLVAGLKERLAFLEGERPEVRMMAGLGMEKPLVRVPEDGAAKGAVWTYQYEFNITPDSKTEPAHAIAAKEASVRVYVAAYRDDGMPHAGEFESVKLPVVWDGRAVVRLYSVPGTEWRVAITVEGNREAMVQKVNGVVDEEVGRFVKGVKGEL